MTDLKWDQSLSAVTRVTDWHAFVPSRARAMDCSKQPVTLVTLFYLSRSFSD
jgi:hypothetical protein